MTPTLTGARIMVQALVARFVEETPAYEKDADWIIRAQALRDRLANTLGINARPEDLYDLITTYEEIQSVSAGTHPDLHQNGSLTINTEPDLMDRLLKQVHDELDELLERATITGRQEL